MTVTELLEDVPRRTRTIEVYGTHGNDVVEHFDTVDVDVERFDRPGSTDGFVLVYDDGAFRFACSLSTLDVFRSPTVHPPWRESSATPRLAEILESLDELSFVRFDRRQLLATSREVERRAWRYGYGTVYAGFQSTDAFRSQRQIFERFVSDAELRVRLYLGERHESVDVEATTVHIDEEFEQVWFVCYDGGGDDVTKCGLVAEERAPNAFDGFWSNVPEQIDPVIGYLRETYG